MTRKQYAVAIENWTWTRKCAIRGWLFDNFGEGGVGLQHETNLWGEHNDYGLENLYMDEEVYLMYKLRW